jgi:putative phosphoesterase
MKVAFFSDIHGNLPALEKAINDAGAVDGLISLGDVVNYGPWSNECVKLLESLQNCIKIKGNHEDYFIEGKCGCDNYLANQFFDVCYHDFREFTSIRKYREDFLFEGNVCHHTIQEKYVFKDTDIELDNNYIIGHSHRQYQIKRNGYYLINPGSVGQNRQYINEINYLIYDTKNGNSDFRSITYNVDLVIDEMRKKNYPKICLDYYKKKPRK